MDRMTKPRVIDDFLPTDHFKRLLAYIQSRPMKYGSKSNSQTDEHGHWSWKPGQEKKWNLADISAGLEGPVADTWCFLRSGECRDMKLIRCYANGYTFGTDGYFHTDSDCSTDITAILYMCDQWELDWAGETVVAANDWTSVLPQPNRALIFPAAMRHCARAVSRKCTDLRTTLIFKSRKPRTATFERLSQWLVWNGALKLSHSSGSLHDHLLRVYQLLEDRKLPACICIAGGLHSIYGTNAFQKILIQPTPFGRSATASFWGKEAEVLAYMFSILDRPKTLNEAPLFRGGSDGEQIMRRLQLRYGQTIDVPQELMNALAMIECANLADQGGLKKWPNLEKVWYEWKPPT